jgi:Tfp pilus assembly protein PilF
MMTRDDRVLFSRKQCLECGEITDLLRFRCPHCSSESFAVLEPELTDEMYGRQKRSQQHVDQGGRLFQQGLVDQALQEFHKAIEANPFNATAHGNIGVIYLRRGQAGKAQEWFEQALEIDPEVPGGRQMLSLAQEQLRR